jgi:hypothetical protein
MAILGMLTWWYTTGWKLRALRLREKIAATIDYFSIDLLVKTLFAPFRQISAGRVDGPIGVKTQAFFDRLISRMIGAIMRTIMIIAGVITILIHSLIGVVSLVLWAFTPFLPFVGLWLFLIGWIPWKI